MTKHIFSGLILAVILSLGACQVKNETPSRSAALMEEAGVHPDRLKSVEGTQNLRDLGGYQSADGRSVKWGIIYRSDNLHELSREGKATLAGFGIRAVTDLRSDTEREQAPDKLPKTQPEIQYSVLPINDQAVDIKKLGRKIVRGEVNEAEIMVLLDHRRFITNPKHRKSWGEWVKSLEVDDNTPHLFHCTSGKDRAGFGAVVTLLTLGVPEETVRNDFLLSNMVYADYIDKTVGKIDKYVRKDVDTDLIRKVMGVSEETIAATFAQMNSDFGSVDGFIRDGLGIDDETRARLQDKFLE